MASVILFFLNFAEIAMNMENKIDIPHTEREVFNKTFLYSVGLVVRFDKYIAPRKDLSTFIIEHSCLDIASNR